ncbi:MAG: type II toxin-antitoxin system RelE/ParE family toxin [Planctomycetota bacterium]|nr:type II toxin-antitoxin system RelE/ParE family toxin [Planctomycetota bacterium]
MKYAVTFAPEAEEEFRRLPAFHRAVVRDAINQHLAHEPTRESKSRIKRLREMAKPQYRLRVGDIRIFYDVSGMDVEVLGIVSKSGAADWPNQMGVRS